MADRLPQRISLPLDPETALMLNVLYLIGEAIMRRDTPAVTAIIRGIAKMAYSKQGLVTRDKLRKVMELHVDAVQAAFEVPADWKPETPSDEEATS